MVRSYKGSPGSGGVGDGSIVGGSGMWARISTGTTTVSGSANTSPRAASQAPTCVSRIAPVRGTMQEP